MGILNYTSSKLSVGVINNGLLNAVGCGGLGTQLDLALLLKSEEQMCSLVNRVSN
jgi:hypothetical protein